MTKEIESNDKIFSRILQKSKLEMPYSDFEDNVMQRIALESGLRKSILKSNRLSLLFFLMGTGFGLILNIFLSRLSGTFLGVSSEKIILFFQVTYILVVLSQLDTIIRLKERLR